MKNKAKFIILLVLIISFGLFKFFVLDSLYSGNKENLILIIFWLALMILSCILLKYPKGRVRYSGIATKMIITSLFITLIIAYLLGFFVGFANNLLARNIIQIIKNIYPIIIIIICREIVRYSILKKCKSKYIVIFSCITFILFDLLLVYKPFFGIEELFYLICINIIPTICECLLCDYLSYNFNLSTTLTYIIPISIYAYILPLVPNLGDYINSVINLLLPFGIYISTLKVVRYINRSEENNKKVKNTLKYFVYIPIIIFLIIIVILVSGIFQYKLIAIASDSMFPTYSRGDAVIYEKLNYVDDIKIDDVLVFAHSGKIITHRVVGITKTGNNILYKTRGDNNNTEDTYVVEYKDVYGVVRVICKYIGFPTVWFNDKINKL